MDTDRVEGKVKETEGETQQKWGEAKDKARDTWEDVKDKVEDVVDRGEDKVDDLNEPDRTEEVDRHALELSRRKRKGRTQSGPFSLAAPHKARDCSDDGEGAPQPNETTSDDRRRPP